MSLDGRRPAWILIGQLILSLRVAEPPFFAGSPVRHQFRILDDRSAKAGSYRVKERISSSVGAGDHGPVFVLEGLSSYQLSLGACEGLHRCFGRRRFDQSESA